MNECEDTNQRPGKFNNQSCVITAGIHIKTFYWIEVHHVNTVSCSQSITIITTTTATHCRMSQRSPVPLDCERHPTTAMFVFYSGKFTRIATCWNTRKHGLTGPDRYDVTSLHHRTLRHAARRHMFTVRRSVRDNCRLSSSWQRLHKVSFFISFAPPRKYLNTGQTNHQYSHLRHTLQKYVQELTHFLKQPLCWF